MTNSKAIETFQFEPVTQRDRDFIVGTIQDNAKRIKKAGWPGMPEGWMPLTLAHNVNALIADGVIKRVTVTKPSKVDPSRTATYTYLTVVGE